MRNVESIDMGAAWNFWKEIIKENAFGTNQWSSFMSRFPDSVT